MFDLFEAFQKIKNKKEFNNFLIDLCTPKEIEDLKSRFKIAQMLYEKKYSQLEISKKVKCSITTVTRVARFLNQKKIGGYQSIIERLLKNKIQEKIS